MKTKSIKGKGGKITYQGGEVAINCTEMERCPRSGHTRCRSNSVSYSGSMERLPNLKGGPRPSSLRHSVGKFIETATLMFSKLLVLDVLIVLFSNVVCLALSGIKRQGFEPRWMHSAAVHTIDVCRYY